MKHAYRISREDSSGAPDKIAPCCNEEALNGKAGDYMEECLNRVIGQSAQKAVITIERIVIDD